MQKAGDPQSLLIDRAAALFSLLNSIFLIQGKKVSAAEGGGLDMGRCSLFHIDGLGASRLEEHDLGIIGLTIIDPHQMVLVSDDLEAEPSIQGISFCSLSSNVDPIQEYLIAAHSLRYYYDCGIPSGWRGGSSDGGGFWSGYWGGSRGGRGAALAYSGE